MRVLFLMTVCCTVFYLAGATTEKKRGGNPFLVIGKRTYLGFLNVVGLILLGCFIVADCVREVSELASSGIFSKEGGVS
mgnify:FL=1